MGTPIPPWAETRERASEAANNSSAINIPDFEQLPTTSFEDYKRRYPEAICTITLVRLDDIPRPVLWDDHVFNYDDIKAWVVQNTRISRHPNTMTEYKDGCLTALVGQING